MPVAEAVDRRGPVAGTHGDAPEGRLQRLEQQLAELAPGGNGEIRAVQQLPSQAHPRRATPITPPRRSTSMARQRGRTCFSFARPRCTRDFMPVERPAMPHIEAWYARLCDRPAFQKHVMFPYGNNPAEWDRHERAGRQPFRRPFNPIRHPGCDAARSAASLVRDLADGAPRWARRDASRRTA